MKRKNWQGPNCPDAFSGRPGSQETRNSHDFRGKPKPNRTNKLSTTGFPQLAARIERIKAVGWRIDALAPDELPRPFESCLKPRRDPSKPVPAVPYVTQQVLRAGNRAAGPEFGRTPLRKASKSVFRPAGEPSRIESGQSPARKPDFRTGSTIA